MKTRNRAMFTAALVCALIAGRASLHAQPANTFVVIEGDDKPWNRGVPIETREAARRTFLEGNRLFNVPLFAQAAKQYIAALSKWKHPAFYFNLALAQLNLGHEVEAHDSLEQALKHGEEPLGADQYHEARRQLQDVERHLGQIRVSCQTTGAEVTLDGATLFTGPGSYEGWVTAKAHEITAKKPDYLSQARRLTVSPGQFQGLDLRLVTLSEAADAGRRWAVWKPWAVIAAGAAIAAGGGVAHALSGKNFADYDERFQQQLCAMSGGCTTQQITPGLNAQLRRAKQEQQIAVGGYIAGGSAIAAGIVLLYLNRPRLPKQEPASSSIQGVAVVPTVSIDMFGIAVYLGR